MLLLYCSHTAPVLSQANELLSDGKGGGSKMRDWMALSGDVRTLRENVEPALLNLSAQVGVI
jgi:hypothetical protein